QPASASRSIWPLAARMPSAMGRSKRPPSLGRSAGARLMVMRRCGYSNCAHRIAARTRSRDSRTAAAGRPTIWVEGKPPERWTSTCTGGAATPARARLCTRARPTGSVGRVAAVARGQARFQLLHGLLQPVQLLARAQQHRALDVELLAGHQVQARQPGLQRGAEAGLQLLAGVTKARRDQLAQAA